MSLQLRCSPYVIAFWIAYSRAEITATHKRPGRASLRPVWHHTGKRVSTDVEWMIATQNGNHALGYSVVRVAYVMAIEKPSLLREGQTAQPRT